MQQDTIGLTYFNLNKYEEAIKEYNKAIGINPAKGVFYYNRSFAFNRIGDKGKALQDVLMAQELGANVNQRYIDRLKSEN